MCLFGKAFSPNSESFIQLCAYQNYPLKKANYIAARTPPFFRNIIASDFTFYPFYSYENPTTVSHFLIGFPYECTCTGYNFPSSL